ncbi:MAG: hypothetical protein Q4D26_00740 [Clostridia bacterium]|nr:hypothetical protein [Clostridia bacterium]
MTELFTLIKNKRKGYFWAANILTILICYGFSLFNCAIGVDDENIVRSLEWRLFETGRFGLNVINLFFNLETFLPGFYMILCLLLMVLANHIVTCKLKLISENSFNEVSSSLFSVVLFSFPNFAYKFIFEQNLLQIGLVYLSSVIVFCISI